MPGFISTCYTEGWGVERDDAQGAATNRLHGFVAGNLRDAGNQV